MLSEVVCLHVDMPTTGGEQLVTLLQDYGRVISKAPVQITEISERPGALFIRWSEVSDFESLVLFFSNMTRVSSPSRVITHEVHYFTFMCLITTLQ